MNRQSAYYLDDVNFQKYKEHIRQFGFDINSENKLVMNGVSDNSVPIGEYRKDEHRYGILVIHTASLTLLKKELSDDIKNRLEKISQLQKITDEFPIEVEAVQRLKRNLKKSALLTL